MKAQSLKVQPLGHWKVGKRMRTAHTKNTEGHHQKRPMAAWLLRLQTEAWDTLPPNRPEGSDLVSGYGC